MDYELEFLKTLKKNGELAQWSICWHQHDLTFIYNVVTRTLTPQQLDEAVQQEGETTNGIKVLRRYFLWPVRPGAAAGPGGGGRRRPRVRRVDLNHPPSPLSRDGAAFVPPFAAVAIRSVARVEVEGGLGCSGPLCR